MNWIVQIVRFFVGVLFIVSGFVKLNDPVGFSFKLEEYFSQGVLNLPFFEPYALIIALVVVIAEVVLGVMLLVGFKPKFTILSLFFMIVFFTFLTFYSAYFNKVTDCGCFGDAIKLTPWESFTKDVVLLVLIVFLVFKTKFIKPLIAKRFATFSAILSLLASIAFANHVINHLPVIDFRAYKEGSNILANMKMPENAPKPIYEYAWKFNVNGEEKIIKTQGDYPSVQGDFVGVETTLIQAGYEPPVHDFTIEKSGQDYAEMLLKENKLLMVISYDLSKSSLEEFGNIGKVVKKAKAAGYKIIGMSASSPEEVSRLKALYQLDFEFYFTDQTTLKTIIRSNPGLLTLKKGTIIKKVHYNDLDKLTF